MYTVDNPIFEAVHEAVYGDIGLTTRILNAIVGVKGNDDKLDFAIALATAKGFDRDAEWAAEEEEARIKNARKRLTRGMRDTVVIEWVMNNVDPGMIVKMTGTRDKGYRQVIKLDSSFGGNVLECRQLEVSVPVGCRRPKEPKYDQLTARPYITNHLLKKVTAVLIDDEWKKVVDLIKEEQGEQSD